MLPLRRPRKEPARVTEPLDLSEPPAWTGGHTGAHVEPLGHETEKVAPGILACFSPWKRTCSLRGKVPPREACGPDASRRCLNGTDRAGHSLRRAESSKPGRFGPVLGEAGRYQDPLGHENIVLGSLPRPSRDRPSRLRYGFAPHRSGAREGPAARFPPTSRGEGAGPAPRPRPHSAAPGWPRPLGDAGGSSSFGGTGLGRGPGFGSRYGAVVGGRRRGSGPCEQRAARPRRPGSRWPRK